MHLGFGFPMVGGSFVPAAGGDMVVSQPSGAIVQPLTLGVMAISQASEANASGTTGADIADLPGVVAVFDKTSTVVQSVASITNGSDIPNAAWTKTNCSAAATGTGTQDRITVTSSGPVVSQTITNAQFISANMVPLHLSWWFSYEDIQWVVIQGRASASVNRVWLDIQNGVVGVTDAGWSNVTLEAENRNGVDGYRFEGDITACAAALTARFGLSTTDGTTITSPANDTTVICDDCTVSQVRVESVQDRVSGELLEQATVNLQPGYEVGPLGEPCRVYYGPQYLLTTEPTHYGAVDGADAEYTLHYVAEVQIPDGAIRTIVGAGNSGVPNNQARMWGQSATGGGRYRSQIHDDAAAFSLIDSSDDIAADAHVGEWRTGAAGTEIYFRKNGTETALASNAQNVGACTLNRMAEGIRPDSTPDSGFTGRVYGWVLTGGAPDAPQNTAIRTDLYSQFGLSGS